MRVKNPVLTEQRGSVCNEVLQNGGKIQSVLNLKSANKVSAESWQPENSPFLFLKQKDILFTDTHVHRVETLGSYSCLKPGTSYHCRSHRRQRTSEQARRDERKSQYLDTSCCTSGHLKQEFSHTWAERFSLKFLLKTNHQKNVGLGDFLWKMAD